MRTNITNAAILAIVVFLISAFYHALATVCLILIDTRSSVFSVLVERLIFSLVIVAVATIVGAITVENDEPKDDELR